MEIVIITAMAQNRVIGLHNRIPWYIPGEQSRFKEVTWGHTVIMGRKTHESIGKPLPDRRNIVVTRNVKYPAAGCEIATSLNQAYSLCRDDRLVFNIGGEQLYHQGIKNADKLILTVLDKSIDGDTFFPEFSAIDFQLISSERFDGPVSYSIKTYHRVAGE